MDTPFRRFRSGDHLLAFLESLTVSPSGRKTTHPLFTFGSEVRKLFATGELPQHV